MRYAFLLLFIGLNSYGQSFENKAKQIVVLNLYDSAVIASDNFSDNVRALELLEKATQIDSTFFLAFARKFDLELFLKQYPKALSTGDQILRLRPSMPLFQVMTGMLYEKIYDSLAAYKYYEVAAPLFEKILDTINSKNSDYPMLVNLKSVNLALLGHREKAINYIKQICPQMKDEYCQGFLIFFQTKSRKELIEEIFNTYN